VRREDKVMLGGYVRHSQPNPWPWPSASATKPAAALKLQDVALACSWAPMSQLTLSFACRKLAIPMLA
jgi:hypothetical protein